MSFQGKYEILSPLSEGESKSFRARQISSGRAVVVHHLAASRPSSQQPDLASLVYSFLRSATAGEMKNFLDMGEAQGHIYVVTADVPECQDLRQWLLSLTEAQATREGGTPPAGEGTPDLRKYELTSDFNTEALRQILHASLGAAAPPPFGSLAASPAVPSPGRWTGVLVPPPQVPAPRPEAIDHSPKADSPSAEKSSPANLAVSTASIPTPPPSGKDSQGFSAVPEVTAEFLTLRSFLGDRAAAPGALTPPQAQPPDREPSPAAVAESAEKDQAAPEAAAVSPAPKASGQPEVEVKQEEKVARRPLVKGFEVVFQSDKPRVHPTLSGAPVQSEVMTFQGPIAGPKAPEVAAPTPAPPGPPQATPPASPGAEGMEDRSAQGFPPPAPEPRQGLGARAEPSRPASPPRPREDLLPHDKTQPLVPVPSAPPGEYTRMVENVKALAGPLPPEVPAAGGGPAASAAVPARAPLPGSYPPGSLPVSPYPEAPARLRTVPYKGEGRLLSARPQRKVWVPMLIFGSLLFLTITLILFFALKQ